MANELPQTERSAKLLTVALEIFRRTMVDSVAFIISNRERSKTGPADWARQAIIPPDSPAAAARGQDLFQPAVPPPTAPSKPVPLASDAAATPSSGAWDHLQEIRTDFQETRPPIPLASDAPTYGLEKPTLPSGFGLGDKPDAVSAFDRPQAVIVVGPNPLPVTMDLSKIGGRAASPTQPRGEREPNAGGALGIGRAIGARFLAVLGPLYALSTVLQQTNSGVGVFGKAVQVLGATLAPILLPVFALLAAGVLSVSDIIWSKLLPALAGFYRWALKFGIPLAEKEIAKVEDTIDLGIAARNLAKGEAPAKEDLPRIGKSLLQFLPGGAVVKATGEGLAEQAERQFGIKAPKIFDTPRGNAAAGTPTDSGTPKLSIGERFSANLRDVIKSLAMSIGPKASYSSLGEVGKQAQLAALNADPIEAKQLRVMQQSLEELQKVVSELQKEDPKEQIARRQEVRRS